MPDPGAGQRATRFGAHRRGLSLIAGGYSVQPVAERTTGSSSVPDWPGCPQRLWVTVDGWLAKLSAPIVLFNDDHSTGIRFPGDIPVEDHLFGWVMITAVLLLWRRRADKSEREAV